ncbi:unnamed protein product [Adineta ricciae]|uniref:Uncharacterized protein n=1 Tax=Adineta ricciae TaxID=249248 RepID=A0A814X2Q3_ADIRI|nr:unnamed protein product [Adineta ricciae]
MQLNPAQLARVPVGPTQPYYYDPSAPYRALLKPQPPPPSPPTMAVTEVPPSNPYPTNRTPPQVVPTRMNTPQTNKSRIPEYYYVDNSEPTNYPSTQPNYSEPYDTYHNDTDPYLQPVPATTNTSTTGSFYPYVPPTSVNNSTLNPVQPVYTQPTFNTMAAPYTTAYVQPLSNTMVGPYTTAYVQAPVNSLPPLERVQVVPTQPVTAVSYPNLYTVPQVDRSAPVPKLPTSDVLNSHQKDSNLSRVEVFHFTPKKKTPPAAAPVGVYSVQPAPQYYTYPYSTVATSVLPHDNSFILQQPHPESPDYTHYPYQYYDYQPYTYPQYSYDYSGYNHPYQNYPNYSYPPYNYPYPSESTRLPPLKKEARGSQTDKLQTTNRAISPMNSHSTPLDKTKFPAVHQRVLLEERLPLLPNNTHNTHNAHHSHLRSDAHYLRSVYSTPLPDCRCIHCQRERAKVLNYTEAD